MPDFQYLRFIGFPTHFMNKNQDKASGFNSVFQILLFSIFESSNFFIHSNFVIFKIFLFSKIKKNLLLEQMVLINAQLSNMCREIASKLAESTPIRFISAVRIFKMIVKFLNFFKSAPRTVASPRSRFLLILIGLARDR